MWVCRIHKNRFPRWRKTEFRVAIKLKQFETIGSRAPNLDIRLVQAECGRDLLGCCAGCLGESTKEPKPNANVNQKYRIEAQAPFEYSGSLTSCCDLVVLNFPALLSFRIPTENRIKARAQRIVASALFFSLR
jgi:hypothetical protein